jgi:3-hydroxyisobutyryl-CoA hydrolase
MEMDEIKEVYDMEYRISVAMMNHTECFEGIRALLIDKDKSPKWKYSAA